MSAAAKPEPNMSMHPGDVIIFAKPQPIIAGAFKPKDNSIAEIIAAATALERVGYEPKLKFAGNGADPEFIQLVVDDVADIMTKLRASLTPTSNIGGSQG